MSITTHCTCTENMIQGGHLLDVLSFLDLFKLTYLFFLMGDKSPSSKLSW